MTYISFENISNLQERKKYTTDKNTPKYILNHIKPSLIGNYHHNEER